MGAHFHSENKFCPDFCSLSIKLPYQSVILWYKIENGPRAVKLRMNNVDGDGDADMFQDFHLLVAIDVDIVDIGIVDIYC